MTAAGDFLPDTFVRTMDIDEILSLLPHRYPFLLVDKLHIVTSGEEGVGVKNVTINEPFFQGHFPRFPVMPGVLLIEAMAQVSGLVVLDSYADKTGKETVFMSVENAKFRKPVRPGDTLKIHVKKELARRNVYRFAGKVFVDGVIVAEAVYTAIIYDNKDKK